MEDFFLALAGVFMTLVAVMLVIWVGVGLGYLVIGAMV